MNNSRAFPDTGIPTWLLIVCVVAFSYAAVTVYIVYDNEYNYKPQLNNIEGKVFASIDNNTTNQEIVDKINEECRIFSDTLYSTRNTYCIKTIQSHFIIAARNQ